MLFTVYNLNNSYFIYEICSKFQQKHLGCYSKGIGVFKFENFHLLVTLFQFFLSFHLESHQVIQGPFQ